MTNGGVLNNQTVRFAFFLMILAACWYLGRVIHFDVAYYQDLFSRYPLVLSGAVFVVLYVAMTSFVWFGPKDVLRISSAIFFGPYVSAVFVWIGEMANAGVMFHLSRILGRDYVRKKLGADAERMEKINRDASFWEVVAWRINPFIPFRLMDLGYGLTPISFERYFAAIVLVSFFRILWLQFILAGIGVSLFQDTAAIMRYFLAHPAVMRVSMLYLLVVAIASFVAVLKRRIGQKIDRKH